MLEVKFEWILLIALLAIVYISQNTESNYTEFYAPYPDPSHTPYKLNQFQCFKKQYDPSKKVDLTHLFVLDDVFGDPRESPTQNVGTLKPPHKVNCHGQHAYTMPDTRHLAPSQPPPKMKTICQ